MADNVQLDAGSGGAVIKTDDDGTAHWQYVKLAFGADNTQTIVTTSAALPVKLAANSGVDVGDVDVTTLPATAAEGASLPSVFMVVAGDDGTDTQPIQLTTGGDLKITTDGETVVTAGVAAHDAAVSGNPVLTGLEARNTVPTAVGNGDTVRAQADDFGRQVTIRSPRDLVVQNTVSLTVSTTMVLIAAGGAGVYRDLTFLMASNPTAADSTFVVYDSVNTGVKQFEFMLASNGGGIVMHFDPPFKAAAANTQWSIKSSEVLCHATAQVIETA